MILEAFSAPDWWKVFLVSCINGVEETKLCVKKVRRIFFRRNFEKKEKIGLNC